MLKKCSIKWSVLGFRSKCICFWFDWGFRLKMTRIAETLRTSQQKLLSSVLRKVATTWGWRDFKSSPTWFKNDGSFLFFVFLDPLYSKAISKYTGSRNVIFIYNFYPRFVLSNEAVQACSQSCFLERKSRKTKQRTNKTDTRCPVILNKSIISWSKNIRFVSRSAESKILLLFGIALFPAFTSSK